MSFVPSYNQDMFVSYSHLDNRLISAGLLGWVDTFVKRLQDEVNARGIKGFEVWSDSKLAENMPLTPQLMDKIKNSATLLVIMSPCYLQSDWCKRERESFLSLVHDRVADGCVFVVEQRQVGHAEYPEAFGDLVPLEFWVQDSESGVDRPLGMPNPDEELYYKRLCRLSYLIKEQMNRLKMQSAPAKLPAPAAKAMAAPVFVARTTDDLEDREEELRSYLSQFGIAVLPQTRYPQMSAEAYEAAMLSDLGRCEFFVQLLSASRGRQFDFLPCKRLTCYQQEVARKAGKKVLLWRDQSLDLQTIKDPGYLALLESARACGIEEFKRAVVDEVKRAPRPGLPLSTHVMIFVNAHPKDRDLARNIGRELKNNGIECFYPLERGTSGMVRQYMENALSSCDGLLLVYGSTGAEWITSQLMLNHKTFAKRSQDRPLKALAVFQGPPPEKCEICADIPDLTILDCRNGVDASILKAFAESVKQ